MLLKFNNEVADNSGGDYSSSTGIFTVPVTGKYSFKLNARITAPVDDFLGLVVKKGDQSELSSTGVIGWQWKENVDSEYITFSDSFQLTEGDQISFHLYQLDTSPGSRTLDTTSYTTRMVIERIADHSAIAPVGFGTSDEADASAKYLLPRIQESGEGDTGTVTWNGTAPTVNISSKYKWVRTGNKVDLWFRYNADTAGSGNSFLYFDFPADLPTAQAFSTATTGEWLGYVGSGIFSTAETSGFNSTTGNSAIFNNSGTIRLYIYVPNTIAAKFAMAHITYETSD